MALKRLLASLDEVAESLRDHYKATGDGQFRLDAEPDTDVGSLVESLKDFKIKTKQGTEKLTSANTRIEVLEAQIEALKTKDPTKPPPKVDPSIEAAVKDATVTMQSELDQVATENKTLKLSMRDLRVRDDLKGFITKSDGVPEILMPEIRRRVKVNDRDDGGFDLEVLDDNGKPEFSKRQDRVGQPMDVGELIEGYKKHDIWSRGFNGTNSSGSGAGGSSGGGSSLPANVRSHGDLKTAEQKADFIDQHGAKAFRELPPAPVTAGPK